MIIEIEGLNVQLIYSACDRVTVVSYDKKLLSLELPALLPQNELIEIVKLIKKNKHKTTSLGYSGVELSVFDKKIPVRLIPSRSQEPYFDRGIIYLPQQKSPKLKSEKFIEQIKIILFKKLIIQSLSRWEDALGILIVDNNFRKLKTKPYITCLKHNIITWNTKLINQPIDLIEYVVLDAILYMSGNAPEKNIEIKFKYIPNWRSYQKIIDHESRYAID